VNALYHLIRADFLERTRRYRFLITLALVLYLGYAVNTGQITLRLDAYRGVFNSAWVGSMMTLVVNFFLGWFGFYLVKNSIARDYETGVGQIMATTPLSRPLYAIGKWLSNFAALGVMVFILMLAAIAMQLIQSEDPQIHLWALVAPFLFVALPFMTLVAALAVFFESIRWLRGSLGNVAYFFLFISGIAIVAIILGTKIPLLDWLGFGIFSDSMGAAARAMYPNYESGFTLGMVPNLAKIQTFYWSGVTWTFPVILTRMSTIVLSIGLVLLGALFFDRFDPSRGRPRATSKSISDSPEPAVLSLSKDVPVIEAESVPEIQLSALPSIGSRFRFGALYLAELRMLLKGQPWWWYLAALGLIVATFVAPLDSLRSGLLPAALIWPTLVWSGLGCRESRYFTRQMVFSAPRPVWNQLPAAWLAGFTVAALMGVGTAMRFALAGELSSLLSLFAGLLFIPSLALMLGVWTGSSKAFEVLYALFWYLGPLNKVLELDYIGIHTTVYWIVYLLLSIILVLLALIGRGRQIQAG
jgi:ABC-type transport system involved in multi-copper enzyme maturation permease subunit